MFLDVNTAGGWAGHYFQMILWLVGAALLGLWLGYAIWSKYKKRLEANLKESKLLKTQNESLSTAVDELNKEKVELSENVNTYDAKLKLLSQNNESLRSRISTLDADLGLLKSKNESLEVTMKGYSEREEEMAMGQSYEIPKEV
ncbi:MAG TPA: hypothetical protein ENK85_03185, partial [Saprospiraceae bacterium]|nr:hypothetical protein [Saprospiraceae bacterium]